MFDLANTYLTPILAKQYLWRKWNIVYSTKYLARLRSEGGGPFYVKRGNRIYYVPHELDDWVLSRSEYHSATSVVITPRPFPKPRNTPTFAELRKEELDGDVDIFEQLECAHGTSEDE